MKLKNLGIAAIFFALLVSPYFAQEAGSRLTDINGAYSFAVPAGWNSNANDEGFAVVNPQKTLVLAVKDHNYDSFASFAADANLERDGLELVGTARKLPAVRRSRPRRKFLMGRSISIPASCFHRTAAGW